MMQEVVSVGLPVDERWRIVKNRIEPEQGAAPDAKRICIVTGTHGDELEGQYVCYELARRINEQKHLLNGIVDIIRRSIRSALTVLCVLFQSLIWT